MCFNITLSDAADVVGECGKHFADIGQIIQLMYKDYHKSPKTMKNLKAVTEAIKCDWISIPQPDMMDMLLVISVCGPVIDKYEAHRAVKMWLHGDQLRRHHELVLNDDDSDEG